MRTSSVALGLVVLAVAVTGCVNTGEAEHRHRAELVIFHAGSLSVPFREVSAAFRKKHPHITIKSEAAGSRDTARKVSELGRRCDVLGSADYKVIRNLLMPKYASFEVRFATNEMVIAHTKRSLGAAEIDTKNWPEVLLADDVTFGRSDADSDPCGYRTVMLFQLAERHYQQDGLSKRLTDKHGNKYIRPKETDLLALLESGELDYVFIYRSVAAQHGLSMIRLPDEINLRAPEKADLYRTASVKVTGRRPGELLMREGAPIVYSVTIPDSAPNREMAEAYLELLLSPEGRAIMEKNGQPALRPALASDPGSVPDRIKPFCQ